MDPADPSSSKALLMNTTTNQTQPSTSNPTTSSPGPVDKSQLEQALQASLSSYNHGFTSEQDAINQAIQQSLLNTPNLPAAAAESNQSVSPPLNDSLDDPELKEAIRLSMALPDTSQQQNTVIDLTGDEKTDQEKKEEEEEVNLAEEPKMGEEGVVKIVVRLPGKNKD